MRFQVGDTQGGTPAWWPYSRSNEIVTWAGETFASHSNATRPASSFKAGAATAATRSTLTMGTSGAGRAWRSSDKAASPGESFLSQHSAQRAAHNVRDNAGSADGP